MLVDNSIIVVDHIHNLVDEGIELKTACIRGVTDLHMPILSGTVASVLAFFPLVLLPDEIGAYIRSLPWVLTLSLGASYFISVSFTPLLAYGFFNWDANCGPKNTPEPRKNEPTERRKSPAAPARTAA